MKKGVYICASVYMGESNITRKVRAKMKTRGKRTEKFVLRLSVALPKICVNGIFERTTEVYIL